MGSNVRRRPIYTIQYNIHLEKLTERNSNYDIIKKHIQSVRVRIFIQYLLIIKCRWLISEFFSISTKLWRLSLKLKECWVFVGKSGLITCVTLCEIRENSWSSASENNSDIGLLRVTWTVAVTLASLKERIESVYICSRTKSGPCWWAVRTMFRNISRAYDVT